MATGQRLGIVAAGLAAGLFAATQFIAWAFYWSPALGAGLSLSPALTLYAPWSVLEWRTRFGAAHRTEFTLALLMIMAGGLSASAWVGSVQRLRRSASLSGEPWRPDG
jgi:hypothetical protein